MSPAESYRITSERLGDHQAGRDAWPLAIAVVKADLLLGLPPAAGLHAAADSDRIRDWLIECGQDTPVLAAERDFAAVRYFLMSSMELDGSGRLSPAGALVARPGRSPGSGIGCRRTVTERVPRHYRAYRLALVVLVVALLAVAIWWLLQPGNLAEIVRMLRWA
jgi:hypothetical protein